MTVSPDSTALTTRPPQAVSAYSARERDQLKRDAQIAKLSWGANIEETTAIAVVLWCRRHDIDPVTEMDVLGNKPCPNAKWYARKIGERIGKGLEYLREDQVQDFPEALPDYADQATKDWAATERGRRFRERTLNGIPHEATGACIVRVKLASLTQEITGASWAGGGTGRKIAHGGIIKKGAEADPIGELYAVESAVTRAYRKAARVLAGHLPELGRAVEAAETEADAVADRVHEDHAKTKKMYAEFNPPRDAQEVPTEVLSVSGLPPRDAASEAYIKECSAPAAPKTRRPAGKVSLEDYLGTTPVTDWSDADLHYVATQAGAEGRTDVVDVLHAEMERRREQD